MFATVSTDLVPCSLAVSFFVLPGQKPSKFSFTLPTLWDRGMRTAYWCCMVVERLSLIYVWVMQLFYSTLHSIT